MSRRPRALLFALAGALAAAPSVARADDLCVLDAVRVSLVDAGATSMLEVSARVRPSVHAPSDCTVAWSRIALSSADPGTAAPSVVLVDGFVEHVRTPPMILADGLSGATPRDWHGVAALTGTLVSVRLLVEDTDGGLHVELPRTMFPPATVDTRVERRVKSAREATAKFGDLGELAIAPTAPGPAGGLGPTGPLDVARVVVECVPSGVPPTETLPPWAIVLDGFRATLPSKALDLSPANDAGWDDLARHAYAAALHGDPVVASLGVSSLGWLAGGLDAHAITLGKTAAGPTVGVVPGPVADAIGDVGARLTRRYGAVGHLLPLGRPSTFRRALRAEPPAAPARATAAKGAVARLAALSPAEVAQFVTPALIDTNAPVDPPVAAAPRPVVADEIAPAAKPTDEAKGAPSPGHRRRRGHRRRNVLVALAALAALALVAAWRSRPRPT
ncbi:MAG: hypothetical protein NVS3B10_26010 [Polyangiales bacterium]